MSILEIILGQSQSYITEAISFFTANPLYMIIGGACLLLILLLPIIIGAVLASKNKKKHAVQMEAYEKELALQEQGETEDAQLFQESDQEEAIVEEVVQEQEYAEPIAQEETIAEEVVQEQEYAEPIEENQEPAIEQEPLVEETAQEDTQEIATEPAQEPVIEVIEETAQEDVQEIATEPAQEPVVEVIKITEEKKSRKKATPKAEKKESLVQPEEQPVQEEGKTVVKRNTKKNSPTAFGALIDEEEKPKKKKKTTKAEDKESAEAEQTVAPKKEKTKKEKKVVAQETVEESVKETVEEPIQETAQEQVVQEKVEVKPEEKQRRYVGKWRIKQVGDGEFASFLYASNGQLLLTSEIYVSIDGAKNGIETIKKNAAKENFEVYRDKKGHYYYKIKSSANRLLCVGETYNNRLACQKAIASVKNFCQDAVLQDTVDKEITMVKYEFKPENEIPVKDGYAGRWEIEQVEEFFMAKLFASNGQLLLAGESYKQYNTAKDSIDSITKNALENNFIIDKDKKGRFYYKLRNVQKSILCVGEAYESFNSAVSAIESVKRFVKTAKLVEKPVEEKVEE